MGRKSTFAISTGEAQRLEINQLLKQRYFIKGCKVSGLISWNNGSRIGYEAEISSLNQEIRLDYFNTDSSGVKTDLDYKIQLTSIPSNLGKGEIWYFICPFTGRKAKILYKVYGSLHFKSRKAYKKRIYYSSQLFSKLYFHDGSYLEIEKKLEKIKPFTRRKVYQGKETKIRKRIRNLEAKSKFHDYQRWFSFPKSLKNEILSEFPDLKEA